MKPQLAEDAVLDPFKGTTAFTPLQALVAKHYAGGEFAHFANMFEAEYCGDTLFVFCLREAGDASDSAMLASRLGNAVADMQSLQAEIER